MLDLFLRFLGCLIAIRGNGDGGDSLGLSCPPKELLLHLLLKQFLLKLKPLLLRELLLLLIALVLILALTTLVVLVILVTLLVRVRSEYGRC